MSWEHLKAVHGMLGTQLAGYEKAAGKLPDPEQLRAGANDDH
jgi:hypothetical protein